MDPLRESNGALAVFSVMFTKDPAHKKAKSWTDGIITCDGRNITLFDMDGKLAGKTLSKAMQHSAGGTLDVGRFALEVMNSVACSEYLSGRIFLGGGGGAAADPSALVSRVAAVPYKLSKPAPRPAGTATSGLPSMGGPGGSSFVSLARPAPAPEVEGAAFAGGAAGASVVPRRPGGGGRMFQAFKPPRLAPAAGAGAKGEGEEGDEGASGLGAFSASAAAAPAAKYPLGVGSSRLLAPSSHSVAACSSSASSSSAAYAGGGGGAIRFASKLRPRHPPDAPGALVLQWPPGTDASSWGRVGEAAASSAAGGVPVVVDPLLTAQLRPHQREGVRFLWECVMGMRPETGGFGAILADDMGLGKTLQTIALVWTMLKQSVTGEAACGKAIIVCPSTLVANWRSEFKKWLGEERLKPIAVHGVGGAEAAALVSDFLFGNTRVHPVLIISYEMLRKHAALLTQAVPANLGRINLLVCDEGHRLKSSGGNKTIAALASLPTTRRVLLTGTPVQNDLSELYAMCHFANPGVLGSLPQFRNTYQNPIEKGRDSSASDAAAALEEERSRALTTLLSRFVLRRTAEVNDAFLPPKSEAIVFVRLSPLQCALYKAIVASKTARAMLATGGTGGGGSAAVLVLINLLRLVCAHGDLVHPDAIAASKQGAGGGGAPAAAGAAAAAASRPAALMLAKRRRLVAPSPTKTEDAGAAEEGAVEEGAAEQEAPHPASTSSRSAFDEEEGGAGDGGGDEEEDEDDVVVPVRRSGNASGKRATPPSAPAASSSAPGMSECIEVEADDEEENDLVADGLDGRPAAGSGGSASSSVAAAITDTLLSLFPGRHVPLARAPAATMAAKLDQLMASSSKLALLDRLLSGVRACAPTDRFVIVSNFATVLSLVEGLARGRGYSFLRLDGSTPSEKRPAMVTQFNGAGGPFLFLLSAQAGGVGLNLIGANRLVLLDSSWNPAVDKQALARVWRDGQKKRSFIYRFVCTRTVEEKVLQRQLLKQGMASAVGHGDRASSSSAVAAGASSSSSSLETTGSGGGKFSASELRELFALDPGAAEIAGQGSGQSTGTSDTHRMMSRIDPVHWPRAFDGVATAAGDDAALASASAEHVSYIKQDYFNFIGTEAGASAAAEPSHPSAPAGAAGAQGDDDERHFIAKLEAAEAELELSDSQ